MPSEQHQLQWFDGGDSYFSELIRAIESAQREILFICYIFEADEVGTPVAKALQEAQQRGVKVRLLLDGIGAEDLSKAFQQKYFSKLYRYQIFRPCEDLLSRLRLFPRLHTKLVVFDRETAFIGGINITKDHLSKMNASCKHDYAVKVTGPIIPEITSYARWLTRSRRKNIRKWVSSERNLRRLRKKSQQGNESEIQFLIRDNFLKRKEIYRSYFQAIRSAQREIIICAAYFMPPQSFLRELKKASKRGVKVSILLQGVPEYKSLKLATQSLYDDLMRAGIEILEHEKCVVHEKVAIIDENWATLGSHNLDPTSILFNLEANLVFRNPKHCAELKEIVQTNIQKGSKPISLEKRGLFRRLTDWFVLRLVKLSLSIFTRPGLYN